MTTYLHDMLDLVLKHKDLEMVDLFVDRLFEELWLPTSTKTSSSNPVIGRPRRLTRVQENHAKRLYAQGGSSLSDIADVFNVHRSTIHRIVRSKPEKPTKTE